MIVSVFNRVAHGTCMERRADWHCSLTEQHVECLEILVPFYLCHLLAVKFLWTIQFYSSGLHILR